MLNPGAVNWLAVLVALIANQVLGFLWYGPLFGKMWSEATGKTPEEMGTPGSSIAIAIVCGLVEAIAMALVLTLPSAVDLGTGLALGLLIAIGFVATTGITGAVFEGKNRTVLGLGLGYQIAGLAIMGAILGAWH